MVRAIAGDTQTTSSETDISNKVFGTDGDPVNLKSQFDACSDGALTFDRVSSNGGLSSTITDYIGADSVITVNLSENAIGTENGIIRNAMQAKAQTDLGVTNLNDVADYVMFCLPPGTSGGWIAYVSVGRESTRLLIHIDANILFSFPCTITRPT